ncbi:hypothetical protein [Marivirga sp.]|uniref:DUF6934 family protein n=1 Tax=Marivirga sp. TaxID=2018662 RepID=UPI0025EF61D1|nr:hypothetical protein [Marivirga sp.]
MKHERYKYSAEKSLMHFEFHSIGPKGEVKKIIEFSETNVKDIYNLAFGDFDEKTQRISDRVVTNNGDSLKVLATVASSVYAFTTERPQAWVFATGSTAVRTRLYRMGLTNNLAEISKDFNVYGLKDDQWEDFIIGEDYEAFLVKRK